MSDTFLLIAIGSLAMLNLFNLGEIVMLKEDVRQLYKTIHQMRHGGKG